MGRNIGDGYRSERVIICIMQTIIAWNHTTKPSRDKTNTIARAPNEDSDRPGHSPSLIKVFAVRSMGSQGSR